MTRRARGILVLAALLLGGTLARAVVVTQQGNQVVIDGVPTALTFARNCTAVADLPAYRALGFNTLLVRVSSPGSVVLQQAETLIDAARREGLYVLIELANGTWSAGYAAGLSNAEYLEDVHQFLDEVVPRFREAPHLVGWIISTVEEGALVSDEIGTFGTFLQRKYGTIERLNAAWSYASGNLTYRSSISSFKILTEATAPQLANPNPAVRRVLQVDIEQYRAALKARDTDFQHFLMTQYPSVDTLNQQWDFQFADWSKVSVSTVVQREKVMPGSSPLSQLDMARYYAAVPRRLMDWWAAQLLHRDPDHLLFAGAQRSYRTIISLPPTLNGVFTECYPSTAEPDLDSHNPQAIDIARRGNRFIVLAGVQAAHTDPYAFAHYLYGAALHGAAGIGVEDWPALTASAAHVETARTALTDMETRRLLGCTPAPHLAIVYAPFPLGPPLAGRPLYGYLPVFPYPGPGTLFFTWRKGTSFGQFDYLAPEDLAETSLARYRVILLPSVLDLPLAAQGALQRFVANGGTAVADLGLGTVQGNGNHHFLPEPMQALFGVLNAPGLSIVRFNLEVYRPHPRFPRLQPGYRTTGVGGGFTIARATRAIPVGQTDLLFMAVQDSALAPPVARRRQPLAREPATGLFINPYGKGFALYAPFPLYHLWTPTSRLFAEFHSDLFREGAPVTLQRPADFLPTFAEVTRCADGSVLLWTKDQSLAVAEVRNATRWAYAVNDGWCQIGTAVTTLHTARPGMHVARPLPIAFATVAPVVKFAAAQATAQGLLFDMEAEGGAGASTRVMVANGEYRVAPGSNHTLTVITAGGERHFTARADVQGLLTFTLPEAHCRVLITGTDSLVGVDGHPGPDPHGGELPVDVVPAPPAP